MVQTIKNFRQPKTKQLDEDATYCNIIEALYFLHKEAKDQGYIELAIILDECINSCEYFICHSQFPDLEYSETLHILIFLRLFVGMDQAQKLEAITSLCRNVTVN